MIHVGDTFVQLSQSTSLIVSEEMKCWRQWSKDKGRPWGKNTKWDCRQIISRNSYILHCSCLSVFLTYPLRQGNGQGQTFKWVVPYWTLKNNNRGILTITQAVLLPWPTKKHPFCFAVQLVGKLVKLTCCPQRLQSMLLVNRPWKGCWNFHGFGIGWRGAAKQTKKTW